MYKIEIPASGGASINNDTEGVGWFTGICDGVLHWRGPTIGFRASGINNVFIDSAWSTTRGLTGTAFPDVAADAAGGLLINGSNSGTVTLAALTVSGATTLTGNVSMAAGLTVTQSSSTLARSA